jgi:hypothetical protein
MTVPSPRRSPTGEHLLPGRGLFRVLGTRAKPDPVPAGTLYRELVAGRLFDFEASALARDGLCFHDLEAPVRRVTGLDIPCPRPLLEHHHLPTAGRILATVAGLTGEPRR